MNTSPTVAPSTATVAWPSAWARSTVGSLISTAMAAGYNPTSIGQDSRADRGSSVSRGRARRGPRRSRRRGCGTRAASGALVARGSRSRRSTRGRRPGARRSATGTRRCGCGECHTPTISSPRASAARIAASMSRGSTVYVTRRRVGVAARARLGDRARRLAVGAERTDQQPARLVGQPVVAVADDRRVLRLGEPQRRSRERSSTRVPLASRATPARPCTACRCGARRGATARRRPRCAPRASSRSSPTRRCPSRRAG